MTQILLRAQIAVDLESIVDRRVVVHQLALDGDEHLRPGDHVALVTEAVSVVAVVDEIDSEGFLHLSMR